MWDKSRENNGTKDCEEGKVVYDRSKHGWPYFRVWQLFCLLSEQMTFGNPRVEVGVSL